jgi:hypothetical protein
MKLLKRTSQAAQHDNTAFAQRLDSIASRSKAGTALYDYREDPSSGSE